jgi:hypothetical protein
MIGHFTISIFVYIIVEKVDKANQRSRLFIFSLKKSYRRVQSVESYGEKPVFYVKKSIREKKEISIKWRIKSRRFA